MDIIRQYFLIFIAYSFIGWIVESTYRTFMEKNRFINSGFLYGPFIPVYGFGAIIILLLESLFRSYPLAVQLVLFAFFCTVLEYFTSFLLEKTLHLRLWDYSGYPLNLNGRICLIYTLFWLALSFVETGIIQPQLLRLFALMSPTVHFVLSGVFLLYILMDLSYSLKLYSRFSVLVATIRADREQISEELRKRIQGLHPIREMRGIIKPLTVFPHLREHFSESFLKLPGISQLPVLKELKGKVGNMIESFSTGNSGNDEFLEICRPIIENSEYLKLKDFPHHGSDVFSHNLKVAWISYVAAKRLKLKTAEMVRGALLHDFFLYNWRKRGNYDEFLPHGFTHPAVSVKNSERVFGRLTSREKDIIIKHMWPLTIIPPRYIESFLVSFIDKIVAGQEILKIIKK